MNYGNDRNMYMHIPFDVRMQMYEKIRNMSEGLEKEALALTFIKGMSSGEAARYAREHNILLGKQGKPICARRIQQIMKEHFPQWRQYTPKGKIKGRKVHVSMTKGINKTLCARCGSSEDIELHHMIPLALGGTTEEPNLICLCRKCHHETTMYIQLLFPKAHKPYKRSCKITESQDGQLTMLEG